MFRFARRWEEGLRTLLSRERKHALAAFRDAAPRRRTLSGILSQAESAFETPDPEPAPPRDRKRRQK
jgi:hypothetical protein